MSKIYVVGMGPGKEEYMTQEAMMALDKSDVIIGYTVYLELLGERYSNKEMKSTPMRKEIERCKMCFEEASKGKVVSMVCSGDAGIYGMAAPIFKLSKEWPNVDIEVISGITAACSGAAVLGAPLNHDFCVISLSDLLTPWEIIEKRLTSAAMGDFAIALYNPSSRKRADYLERACKILLDNGVEPTRCCGIVENIGREKTVSACMTLGELKETQVNMFTTVFIGNSQSEFIGNKLVTNRGYQI